MQLADLLDRQIEQATEDDKRAQRKTRRTLKNIRGLIEELEATVNILERLETIE